MAESNRIEHKAQLTKDLDLEKEVVAFLNYHEGGLIYIGIDKAGDILGVADWDNDMLKIKDRIKNNISPSAMGLFDVVTEEKAGKTIIKIIVASGSEKPYFKKKYGMTEKGCYLRIGTAAEPMPEKLIQELFASRTRNSIGKIKAHQQNLRFQQLSIYYQEKTKNLNRQFKKNLELLTEDGSHNYAAYLLADINNISIKVAKYRGLSRVELTENNEYGYCSLIKATNSVLDKIEVENTTFAKITSRKRIERRLWNPVALREAILNAFVHNDYTREVPPKFEIFDDRIEITSAGALPEGLSQDDFFDGVSIPRNKELMRVYKDVELVEQLGSGIPRILQHYGKECFQFMDGFTRMVFASSEKVTEQVTEQVTGQVKTFIRAIDNHEYSRTEIMEIMGLKHRASFSDSYVQPALEMGLIELTIPDKPNSSRQKYRLTQKGKNIKPTDQVTDQVREQVTEQVKTLIRAIDNHEYSRTEIMEIMGLKHRTSFSDSYVQPALEMGLIELTIPDKPNSSRQKYRLTQKGKNIKPTDQVTDQVREQVTEQVTEQVKTLIRAIDNHEYSRTEIMEIMGLKHRTSFSDNYIQPTLEMGLIELTIPDKPNSSRQKYRLTQKGKRIKTNL